MLHANTHVVSIRSRVYICALDMCLRKSVLHAPGDGSGARSVRARVGADRPGGDVAFSKGAERGDERNARRGQTDPIDRDRVSFGKETIL